MRQAARALVVDAAGRILLLWTRDPARPGTDPWWEMPGGGLEPGEDAPTALVRELAEEAGIEVSTDRVGPPLWHRETHFSWCGRDYHQRETLHVVLCGEASPGEGRHRRTVAEWNAILGMRWWTVDDLVASGDRFFPGSLPASAPVMLAGQMVDDPYENWEPFTGGRLREPMPVSESPNAVRRISRALFADGGSGAMRAPDPGPPPLDMG